MIDWQTHSIWQKLDTVRQRFAAQGWQWRVVGGALRNIVLQRAYDEIDIEVVGVSIDDVAAVLSDMHSHGVVGTDKPIVRLHADWGWLDVSVTPHADVIVSTQYRDLTINALVLTPDGMLHDPHGGVADIEHRLLRHVDDHHFGDDPVRVLRLMRLAAQLDFGVHPDTAALAARLLPHAPHLTPDRVWNEWRRWALSDHPRQGLIALQQCGWLPAYPMLVPLVSCPQDPVYHPEGDVWVHTGFVCQHAVVTGADLDEEQRITLLLSALCHDLGKPYTTSVSDGRIISPGHAAEGVPYTEEFLALIHTPERFVEPIKALVREHMAVFGAQVSPRMVRRLAARLHPSDIDLWSRLTHADGGGSPPLPVRNHGAEVMALALQLQVVDEKPVALVRGEHVLALGVAPGKRVGELLNAAYEAQLDGEFGDVASGVAWLQRYYDAQMSA
jgi:tRNA nucleotidyltransferase (CCA-adding enzyme)